jgi:glycine/D-amino acid oxidase-like deaminating enzyme
MSDSLIILGGGIIGLSIAYYASLSQPSRKIIVVDSERSLLLSASGFSGGYLVRDWFSSAVLPLAELSFQLHRSLAEANDGRSRWGYSESIAYSLVMELAGSETGTKLARGEDWLLHGTSRADVARQYVSAAPSQPEMDKQHDGAGRDSLLRQDESPVWANMPAQCTLEKISSPSGCAQVEPRQLCEWLIQECRSRGVQFCLGTKTLGTKKNAYGEVSGLHVEQSAAESQKRQQFVLPCKDIVISAGCWTPRVFETLVGKKMSTGIRPLPGYSRVVRSPRFNRPIRQVNDDGTSVDMSHAIFCPPTPNWTYSPECMARYSRDGRPEIYIAGLNDESIALPEVASDTKGLMERSKLDDLGRTAIALTGAMRQGSVVEDDLELVREGLCFRPVSESGLPIITRVDNLNTTAGGSLYVASGHGPWGIALSLGTGFVMAEMLNGIKPREVVDEFDLKKSPEFLRAHL